MPGRKKIRTTPLMRILLCGVVLLLLGIFLALRQEEAGGRTSLGRFGRSGFSRGSDPAFVIINGGWAIGFGVAFILLSLYFLNRNKKRKNG